MPLVIDQPRYSLGPIWLIVTCSMLAMVALQAAPESWRLALRYDRTAIASGEIWRLLTGHFVHLGWNHLALNLAGLGLGTWLFGADRSAGYWVLATLASVLACSAGLYWFTPSIEWCVGLSGVLHGLMIAGFGGWYLAGDRSAAWLLAVVIGKISWEQLGGEMPWADSLAGGNVVTEAHLWGAAGGAFWLLADLIWRRYRARL